METQNVTQNCTDEVKSRAIVGNVDFYENSISTDPAYVANTYATKINGTSYNLYRVPNVDCLTPGFFEPEILNFGITDNGTATIEIGLKNNVAITNYMIRPKRFNSPSGNKTYSAVLSNGKIQLTIRGPQLLCVEVNSTKQTDRFIFDDPVIGKSLLIFANPIETDIPANPTYSYPARSQPHVIPGGTLTLNSNQTVYIAPGAIVHGAIRTAPGANNVKIMGRGILSGKNNPTGLGLAPHMISFRNATNSSAEGIILVNSKNWAMPLFGSENITIDRVKIASYTGYEDGIDVVGCRNVYIRNCFIWTTDDCIAVKCGVNYNQADRENGIPGLLPGENMSNAHMYNINVNNCVIWNGNRGNALEIGCELNAYRINNVNFHNTDIIHALTPNDLDQGALSINNNGNGRVNQIEYYNIYIEDVKRYFMNIKIEQTVYSPGGEEFLLPPCAYSGGYIYDIFFNHIYLTKYSKLHSAFLAINQPSSDNSICNVNLTNFYINGNRINHYYPTPDEPTSNNFVLVNGSVNFNINNPNW